MGINLRERVIFYLISNNFISHPNNTHPLQKFRFTKQAQLTKNYLQTLSQLFAKYPLISIKPDHYLIPFKKMNKTPSN
jgi:hypothetical protein